MSLTPECGSIKHSLFGLLNPDGTLVNEINPLSIRADWADGWSILDDQGAIVYYGFPKASPDDDTDPDCSILKVETIGNVTTRKWAGGSLEKNLSWSLRTTYDYYFLK
jgi:hypothetical protein